MKKLLFLTLLLSSISFANDPIYKLGQKVRYKVRPFLTLVCDGTGIIQKYEELSDSIYYILLTNDTVSKLKYHCPDQLIKEDQILSVEKE